MVILNPEAVGDPNQTPIVYLGPAAAAVLSIPQRDPLAICEWCFAPVADPLALCDQDDCRAKTSQLDAAIAVAVAEELDHE